MVSVSEERPVAVAPTRDALLSNLTFHAWRDAGVQTLTELAGYERREHTVTLPDETIRVAGAGVTAGLLAMLGAAPVRGRLFACGLATCAAMADARLPESGAATADRVMFTGASAEDGEGAADAVLDRSSGALGAELGRVSGHVRLGRV